jgi:hypothetical protein
MSRFALEPIETTPRRRLFSLPGVNYLFTPNAWFSLLLALAILPGPALDGAVIVREMRGWTPRR